MVSLLHGGNFGLNEIPDTLKDVSGFFLFVRKSYYKSLKRIDHQGHLFLLQRIYATKESILYKRNVLEGLKNQMVTCSCAAHLQLHHNTKERF